MVRFTIEHGTRLAFQEKTRQELHGPFWNDYKRSIRWPRQWEDTDSWLVNYLGHPIQGAAAGLIWLDAGAHEASRLSLKPSYWASRGRAAAFIAGDWAAQRGINRKRRLAAGDDWVGRSRRHTGGGFALLVAEDALDRYFVEWFERRVGNRVARATARMLFNPSRTLADLAENRAPWRRADRGISNRPSQ